jgi:periplasmic divalent cation tolerance protein
MTDKVVVFVTSGKAKEAKKIATALVDKRLAACVNVVPRVRSYFRWEGKVQNETEHLLVIKSSRGRFTELRKEIERLHTYTVPEIICVPIVEGADPYMNWLDESLTPALAAPAPGRR